MAFCKSDSCSIISSSSSIRMASFLLISQLFLLLSNRCTCWSVIKNRFQSSSKKHIWCNSLQTYPGKRFNTNILSGSGEDNVDNYDNNREDENKETSVNLEREKDMILNKRTEEDEDDDTTNVQDIIDEMTDFFTMNSINKRKEKMNKILNNDSNEDSFLLRMSKLTEALKAKANNNEFDLNDITMDEDDGVMLDTETYLQYSRMNTFRDQDEVQRQYKENKIPKFTSKNIVGNNPMLQYDTIFESPEMSPPIPNDLFKKASSKEIHDIIFSNEKGFKDQSVEFQEFLMPGLDKVLNDDGTVTMKSPWDVAKLRAEAIRNATYTYRHKKRREQEQNITSLIDNEVQSLLQQDINTNSDISDDNNTILLSEEEINSNNTQKIYTCKVCNCRISLQEVKHDNTCRSCYVERNFVTISPYATTNNNNKLYKRQESFTFSGNDDHFNENNHKNKQKSFGDRIKLQRKQQRHASRLRQQRLKEQQLQKERMDSNDGIYNES